jgi:hypothetical protein
MLSDLVKLLCVVSLFSIQLSNEVIAKTCNNYNDSNDYMSEKLSIDGVEINLHFAKNKINSKFLVRSRDILEYEIKKIHKYFNYRPQGGVHIRIPEYAEMSNGSAQVMPYNIIELLDFEPEKHSYLGLTEDWIQNLIIHEYVHIVTLDMTTGAVDTLRSVFGGIVKPTGIAPRWLSEGVATWWESKEEGQGRLNQDIIKWEVYKAFKNPEFCTSFSCLDQPLVYPYGHAAYWVGGFFLKFLEDQKPGFLQCLYKEKSNSLPFRLNSIFISCRGTQVAQAYYEFRRDFLEKNKRFENYCPVNEKFCKTDNLLKANISSGYCETEDSLIYITKEVKGRNRKNANHHLKIISLKSNTIKNFYSEFPIIRLDMDENNNCIIKESHYGSCIRKSAPIIKILNPLTLETSIYTDKKVLDSKVEDTSMEENQTSENQEYNGSKYLMPKFFIFNTATYGGLTSTEVLTSINDPLNIHSINANISNYSHKGENLLGGSFSYTYRKNSWAFSLSNLQLYSYNSFFNEVSNFKAQSFGLELNSGTPNWAVINTLVYSKKEDRDFLSKKEYKQIKVSTLLGRKDKSLTRSLRDLTLRIDLSGFEVERPYRSHYIGVENFLNSSFYLTDETFITTNLNYGKLNKSTLLDGTLKAGGANSFNGGYRYPLYMFNYGDVFGNELITANVGITSSLIDLFYGDDMFPFFSKDFGITVGSEYTKAKYFYFADKLISNEYASSVYAGLFLNNQIAYRWDTSLKLILSRTMHPKVDDRVLFLLDAAEFF